jgi:hypothetical protein
MNRLTSSKPRQISETSASGPRVIWMIPAYDGIDAVNEV